MLNIRLIRMFRELSRSLSFRAGAFCIGAIVCALMAVLLAQYVPDDLAELLGGEAVDRILMILASSMLVVVTFSLSTIIAAYSIASSSAPARATRLIMDDKRAQTALSTFLGAFIFSIVSLVALSTKYYGPKGRVILFFITVLVLSAVILTIIGWIGHLSRLGRLGNVIDEVENMALTSIRTQSHWFAWHSAEHITAPNHAIEVASSEVGFIQVVDLKKLSGIVDSEKCDFFIESTAGQFVYPHFVLGKIVTTKQPDEQLIENLRSCFIIGNGRTFEDDPRFGFIVLSEIASRALSPGINDPGTAIQVIGSLTKLFSKLHLICVSPHRWPWSKRLHVRPLTSKEVVDDAFRAISRDGAAIAEVSIFLQKALRSISLYPEFKEAAYAQARQGLERCRIAITNGGDLERVESASIVSDIKTKTADHPQHDPKSTNPKIPSLGAN